MLAERPMGEVIQVQEIAERQNVPKKFLELIMLDLKRHGIVYSIRGRGGGFVLARPSDSITFGHVIRLMEGPLAPLPCASVSGYRRCADCLDEKTCVIRKLMRRVRDATADILDRTTLADALHRRLDDRLVATVA
jgi:Rrf2 family protein